jgi:hypothetical protein
VKSRDPLNCCDCTTAVLLILLLVKLTPRIIILPENLTVAQFFEMESGSQLPCPQEPDPGPSAESYEFSTGALILSLEDIVILIIFSSESRCSNGSLTEQIFLEVRLKTFHLEDSELESWPA